MDRQARDVMAAGAETVDLHVGHVREPRDGTTGRLVGLREGPPHVRRREPASDVRVFDDELEVVVVNEVEVSDWGEGGDGEQDQEDCGR